MHYTRAHEQGEPAYAYQLSQPPTHRDCAHCDDVTDTTRTEHVLTHRNSSNLLFTTSIIFAGSSLHPLPPPRPKRRTETRQTR